MRHVLLEIWRLLDPRQKRRLLLLQLVSIFMAFSTVLGIAAVMPFFAVLSDPSIIESNAWLAKAYRWSGLESTRSFVLLLGLGLIGMIVFSNAVNLIGKLAMTRFAFWISNDLQITLFNEYLNRDYLFHARTNSATLVNKTTSEVGRVTNGILQQSVSLVTNVVTIGAIVATVVLVNPLVAVAAAVLLGGSYALIYWAVRQAAARLRQAADGGRAGAGMKALQEGFGGIKEIIVLNVRGLFAKEFSDRCWEISKTSADAQVIDETPRPTLECIAVGGLVALALFASGICRDRGHLDGPGLVYGACGLPACCRHCRRCSTRSP